MISWLTSHYVVKKILRNKLYTYILYINDELKSLTKTIKMTVMTKKAGGSGDDDDDVCR